MNEHTFVICAYRESPYLVECIQSLRTQTVPSEILMVTSTPNDHIRNLAERYDIPLYLNPGPGGITQDWNYGYSRAKTPYVTIAHQDDVYLEDYARRMLEAMEGASKPLLYFTDYGELREGKPVLENSLLKVKRLMLAPLKIKAFQGSRWVRRRVLSMGCPICCPSVSFARNNLPEVIFEHGYRSCEDWQAWERLSRLKGSFLYDPQVQMYHRIHPDSETSTIIGDNARSGEEYEMYRKFWPAPVARALTKFYAKGQKSNTL